MSDFDAPATEPSPAGASNSTPSTTRVGRRVVLAAGALVSAGWLLGCRGARLERALDAGSASAPNPVPPVRVPASANTPPPVSSAQYRPNVCTPTEANIEGPFFKPGAPRRRVLAGAESAGTRLELSGRVLGPRCAPLAGAVLEVWHADHQGRYDEAGYAFRGTVDTDPDGGFVVETIVPGRYLNGRSYRPAHLHVKLSAAGHRLLTTQLYFQGDPYNHADPFVRRSLVVPVEQGRDGLSMRYDFVLVAA